MAVHTEIETEEVENLFLDVKNPRLGRRNVEKKLSQPEILALMQKFTLDELGISIVNGGFWPQEAVIVVKEKIGNSVRNVVVEGNRRLAACKMLKLTGESGCIGAVTQAQDP